MIKKITLFFFILSLFPRSLIAQDSLYYSVAWSPASIFFNSFKIDFGIKATQNSWFILSPHVYYSNGFEIFDDDNFTEMYGYGGTLLFRSFIIDNALPKGPYFGVGLFYSHFSVKYEDTDWYRIEYTGLSAITYGNAEHTTTIDKLGPDFIFGHQFVIGRDMIIDMFWGAGLRKSFFASSTDLAPRKFDGFITGYGYSGIVFLTGVRIGMLLY